MNPDVPSPIRKVIRFIQHYQQPSNRTFKLWKSIRYSYVPPINVYINSVDSCCIQTPVHHIHTLSCFCFLTCGNNILSIYAVTTFPTINFILWLSVLYSRLLTISLSEFFVFSFFLLKYVVFFRVNFTNLLWDLW